MREKERQGEEGERRRAVRGEIERMRGPSFLSCASASGASKIGAYDMQPFAYI